MRKLTFTELQAQRVHSLQGNPGPRLPVSVILDDIRSLHNVGAVFRTADAVGLEHLYLCGISGTPPRDEIRKTSLGAEESVAWSYQANAVELAKELQRQQRQVVVLEQTTASIDFRQAVYRFPLVLVIGHEYHGINDELVACADLAIDLPMHGKKHSLNVSVAFGVAIYEIMRRWEETNALGCL